MNYKDYNDNELLNYISESNEEASEILYEKYRPLIYKLAKKLYDSSCKSIGLELNDLIQEGMLGLNSAINHYNEAKDNMFYTFAKTCIERRMISTVVSAKRLKHKILNDSIPIEIQYDDNNFSLDYLFGDSEYNPENIVIDIEEQKELLKKTKDALTPFEIQVFELKMNGFDYKEISDILDKNSKAIDNAIQRIKNKVKKIIEEKDI